MIDPSEITSIQQLLNKLDGVEDHRVFNKIAENIKIEPSAFTPYAIWNQDYYSRICIHRTAEYELLLLCWEPGQSTAIHCHNSQECWMLLIEGALTECQFNRDIEKVEETLLSTDKRSHMNDDMGFHSIVNHSNQRAMTLHLYAKPIDRCRVYDEELGKFSWKKLEYHKEGLV